MSHLIFHPIRPETVSSQPPTLPPYRRCIHSAAPLGKTTITTRDPKLPSHQQTNKRTPQPHPIRLNPPRNTTVARRSLTCQVPTTGPHAHIGKVSTASPPRSACAQSRMRQQVIAPSAAKARARRSQVKSSRGVCDILTPSYNTTGCDIVRRDKELRRVVGVKACAAKVWRGRWHEVAKTLFRKLGRRHRPVSGCGCLTRWRRKL